jgi:phosphoglycerate dehydrogenase-like enzyme
VAEHLLAVLLMAIKKLHIYRDDQKNRAWKDEGRVKEISKLRVTILGLGDIGSYLAGLLKALGIYVIGVKRKAIEKPDCVDELYTNKDLDKAIADVDAVISLLPGNKENAGLFTIDTFRKMRKDCIFINAGRGNLCDEETLQRVLDEKIIDTIAADVYPIEPLPADSPLWDHENLIVTPHAAGGYHLDSAMETMIDLCIENLNRYSEGRPLRNLISERE